MKRLIRYRKKIVSLMCAVMVISIGIFSTSFVSKAETYSVNSVHSEPVITENGGYLSVLVNIGNVLSLYTYVWDFEDFGSTSPTSCTVDITVNQSNVSFSFLLPVNSTVLNFWELNYAGSAYRHYSSTVSTNPKTFSSSFNGTILAISVSGHYGILNTYFGNYVPQVAVVWNEDAKNISELIRIYNMLYRNNEQNSSIIDRLESIASSNWSIDLKLSLLIDLQEQSNTWLQKIWNSIQEFITPKNEDEQKADDFNSESESQKNEIDSLNGQNQTNQVDVNSASSQVDANINYENMAQYGGILATITNNNYVLQMILIVVSIAIIAYVLFGKR